MSDKKQDEFFQYLFNYYNERLFQGKLPDCRINICREEGAAEFFTSERLKGTRWERIYEINLTAHDLALKTIEWHAVLVHNMVHLWQFVFGTPADEPGYHNEEYVQKLEELGFIVEILD